MVGYHDDVRKIIDGIRKEFNKLLKKRELNMYVNWALNIVMDGKPRQFKKRGFKTKQC
ncbi:hypothetical protein P4T34_23305 [Bacillus mobilis]|nr:hypothetical protein [Bacillus mobilis]